jgi:hypothetical protein
MKRLACTIVVLVGLLVGLAGAAAAQTTITLDPQILEFDPSLDHNVTDLAGVFVVSSYQFDAIAQNTLGAIALTYGLGKPVPSPTDGKIRVNLATLLSTITPNATYYATVTTIGPGGSAVSAPSNPFGHATASAAPRAATNVRLSRS